jgi:hypothetical protein
MVRDKKWHQLRQHGAEMNWHEKRLISTEGMKAMLGWMGRKA